MQQAGQMEDKLKVLMKKMKEQQQLKDIKDDDSVEYIG